MAQTVAVVRGTLSGVASSTTDFTASGFGAVAAAIVLVDDTRSGANPANNARIGVGFWDGTSQVGLGFFSGDGLATAATRRAAGTAAIIAGPNYPTSGYGYTASIANITDGVRITQTGTTNDRYVTVILLGGVSAKIQTLTINNTNGGTVASASLGFAPKLLLMGTIGNTTTTSAAAGILSLSVAESGGLHRGLGFCSLDAAADAAVNQLYSETRLVGQVYNGWNAWNAEVTTWGADSLTITTRDGASGSDLAYLLILGGADLSYSVGTVTTRTSTGTDTISTTGIDPDAVLMMVGTTDTAGSIVSDSRANGLMIGAADASGQYSHSIYDEDAAATSNTGSVSSATTILDLDSSASGSRTDVATASVTLGSGKFTLDYSAADATARKGWYIAFGEATSGGTTYNESISETVSASDALAAAALLSDALSEAASAADVVAAAALYASAIEEAASAGDAVSDAASFDAALSESASADDSVSSSAALPAALSESASATDALSSSAEYPATLSESASAADEIDGSIAANSYSAELSESASASDGWSATYALAVSLVEAVSAADVAAASAVLVAALQEAATAGDALSAAGLFADAISEAASASDAWSATGDGARVLGALVAGDIRRQMAIRVNVQTAQRSNIQTSRRGN